MLTKEKLDELARLEAAATPGEWTTDLSAYLVVHSDGCVCSTVVKGDAVFIAGARNALPALIAMAREQAETNRFNIELIDTNARQMRQINDLTSEANRLGDAYLKALRASADARNRYLAALKTEACDKWKHIIGAEKHGLKIVTVQGITFRVTRNQTGELVAEEVTNV